MRRAPPATRSALPARPPCLFVPRAGPCRPTARKPRRARAPLVARGRASLRSESRPRIGRAERPAAPRGRSRGASRRCARACRASGRARLPARVSEACRPGSPRRPSQWCSEARSRCRRSEFPRERSPCSPRDAGGPRDRHRASLRRTSQSRERDGPQRGTAEARSPEETRSPHLPLERPPLSAPRAGSCPCTENVAGCGAGFLAPRRRPSGADDADDVSGFGRHDEEYPDAGGGERGPVTKTLKLGDRKRLARLCLCMGALRAAIGRPHTIARLPLANFRTSDDCLPRCPCALDNRA